MAAHTVVLTRVPAAYYLLLTTHNSQQTAYDLLPTRYPPAVHEEGGTLWPGGGARDVDGELAGRAARLGARDLAQVDGVRPVGETHVAHVHVLVGELAVLGQPVRAVHLGGRAVSRYVRRVSKEPT